MVNWDPQKVKSEPKSNFRVFRGFHLLSRRHRSNSGFPGNPSLTFERRRPLYIQFRGPSEFMVEFYKKSTLDHFLRQDEDDFNFFWQKIEVVRWKSHTPGFHFHPLAASGTPIRLLGDHLRSDCVFFVNFNFRVLRSFHLLSMASFEKWFSTGCKDRLDMMEI